MSLPPLAPLSLSVEVPPVRDHLAKVDVEVAVVAQGAAVPAKQIVCVDNMLRDMLTVQ